MDARNFIDLVGANQNSNAVDALTELLASKAFDALENKKKEMATSLFNGVEIEQDEQEDLTDTEIEQ
jgi:hypothetical protein